MPRVSGHSTSSDILSQLGSRIRSERKRIGLSQEALADQAGIDRSHMGKIERGERNVTILNVERIAHALSMELTQLVQSGAAAAPAPAPLAAISKPPRATDSASSTTVSMRKIKARFDDGQPRFVIFDFELYPVILAKHVSGKHYSEPFANKPEKLRNEILRCLNLRKCAVLVEDVPGSSDWHMQGLYYVANVSMTAKLELTLGALQALLTEEHY